MASPEEFDDFRVGDELPDAHIDGFKVYGGSPGDRARLHDGDPELLEELGEQVRDAVDTFESETHPD